MKRAPSAAKTKRPSIMLQVRLDLPGAGRIGPGKIELLRQIGEHRSIAAAARAMDMSYRRAWLLVDELNNLFAQPLVAKWLGGRSRGGATLTPAGARLVRSYETVVRRAEETNRALLSEILQSTQRAGRSAQRRAA
jgi:molybdate transport system regulatory protein